MYHTLYGESASDEEVNKIIPRLIAGLKINQAQDEQSLVRFVHKHTLKQYAYMYIAKLAYMERIVLFYCTTKETVLIPKKVTYIVLHKNIPQIGQLITLLRIKCPHFYNRFQYKFREALK